MGKHPYIGLEDAVREVGPSLILIYSCKPHLVHKEDLRAVSETLATQKNKKKKKKNESERDSEQRKMTAGKNVKADGTTPGLSVLSSWVGSPLLFSGLLTLLPCRGKLTAARHPPEATLDKLQ